MTHPLSDAQHRVLRALDRDRVRRHYGPTMTGPALQFRTSRRRTIAALVRRGLVEPAYGTTADECFVVLTDAGLAAVLDDGEGRR